MREQCYRVLAHCTVTDDGRAALHAAIHTVSDTAFDTLQDWYQRYYAGELSLQAIDTAIDETDFGLSRYTVRFVVIAAFSKAMQEQYRAAGYPESLFYDTLCGDLSSRFRDTIALFGVWGVNNSLSWYDSFFRLRLFTFHGLQFERYAFKEAEYREFGGGDITVHGRTMNEGDTFYYFHIPPGTPFSREDRLTAYREAYRFFTGGDTGEPLVFACWSWLLYPAHRELLPPHYHIVSFLDDWKIVLPYEDRADGNLWRIFGKEWLGRPFDGNAAALPRDTGLQRHVADWLAAGHHLGWGVGFMLFDGHEPITD